MLKWAIVFFVVALIAALFGFELVASAFAGVARIAFAVFLVLFVISILAGLLNEADAAI